MHDIFSVRGNLDVFQEAVAGKTSASNLITRNWWGAVPADWDV